MAENKPALITQTKLNNEETRDVGVVLKRTVTYVVNIPSASNLSLPYAVAVNGVVQSEFKNGTKKIRGKDGRIIVHNVDPGAQVTLFLNSDAHPRYRRCPVYAVSPREKNILVSIVEKKGKNSDTDTPTKTAANTEKSAAGGVEEYVAALTGDIWMKVSHKYSSDEVDELLPSGTSKAIRDCVKKIYDGLAQPSLEVSVPAATRGEPVRKISITFDDATNPHENISRGYDLLTEGLTRVHPAGYAAVFTAAIDAQVDKVVMTSAWRPMLGSIAHRAGLGLDVNYIGAVRMNREALRRTSATRTNVTQEEQQLLHDFEAAKFRESAAKKEVDLANSEVRQANGESQRVIVAKQRLKDATQASEIAVRERKSAEVKWNAERDTNEPDEVKRFRNSLIKCESVAQLFDPWFMDSNNRDGVAPVANMQIDANEKLHAHHLHITVYDPRII